MNNNENRILYLDIAKGIGIILIAMGHLSYIFNNPVNIVAAGFKIAVFYIISGLLFHLKYTGQEIDIGAFNKKNALGLGVSYVLFSLVVILTHIPSANFSKLLVKDLWAIFSLRGLSTLWFLPTLFFGEVLLAKLYQYTRKEVSADKKKIVFSLALFFPIVVSLLLYFAHVDFRTLNIYVANPLLTIYKSLVAFFFLLVGYLMYDYRQLVDNHLAGIISGAIAIGAGLLNKGVDLNNGNLGKIFILFYLTGICGSWFVLYISKQLHEKVKEAAVFAYCGKESLFIMCSHTTFRLVANILKLQYGIFKTNKVTWKYYFCWFENVLVLFALEACLIVVKNKLMHYFAAKTENETIKKALLKI